MKETIFLTAKIKQEEKVLNDVLDKLGIVHPNPVLGFFHFVYSPIEEANLNGVRLAEKAVEISLPQLKQCQCNINHLRLAGCGSILDSWVNTNNEIEIIVSFFKNLFPKEYAHAMELYNKNKLFVSFELCTNPNSVETLPDGTKRVHEISWEGVGILMDVAPAYPAARALETASKIIEDFMAQEDKQLIYANVESISKKWLALGEQIENIINEKAINDKQNIKEETIVDNKVNEQLLAKFKADLIAEKGDEVKDWTDEQFAQELEKRANEDKSKETPASPEKKEEASEVKPENKEEAKEIKQEEKKEEASSETKPEEIKEEAQIVNETTTTTTVYDVTRDDEKGTMEVVETITTQKEVDGKVVMEEKKVRNTLYAQEKVDAIKADYDAKIAEKDSIIAAKNDEIKNRDEAIIAKDSQIKLIKENAKLIVTKRESLGEFAKDLSDEDLIANNDKVRIAELKKENDELKKAKTDNVVTAEKKDDKIALEASANGDNVEVTPEVRRKVMKIKTGQKV